MGCLFFDDSKHDRHGFSLGAFVYADRDPGQQVSRALQELGLRPGIDEFKSSSHMKRNPTQAKLRQSLRNIVHMNCQLGVVVVRHPSELGSEALLLLRKMLDHPCLRDNQHNAYFDQGLFDEVNRDMDAAIALGLVDRCDIHLGQDSRLIGGIQLADLVAHTCGVMLAESLGYIHKTVKAGHNSGYDPDLDINIGFELWASIRYNFLSEDPPQPDEWIEGDLQPVANVLPFGLHVSSSCSQELRETAIDRFGEMYLGCIH